MTTKVKPSVLADTAVSVGTYGGSTQQAVFTVDAQGRLTYAGNATPSIATTQLTGKITSSQIDTVASSQITGTLTLTQVDGMAGEIKMWPSVSAPTGYLLCDGSSVSRTTYAGLFAIIGTTYGTGNGSTTFNLPNFTNRMPIGVGDAGTYTMGSVGGSKDAVVVVHTHGGSTGAGGQHYHATGNYSNNNGTWFYGTYSSVTAVDNRGTFWNGSGGGTAGATSAPTNGNIITSAAINTTVGDSHTHSMSINSAGVSANNANLPPYLGVQFIIRH